MNLGNDKRKSIRYEISEYVRDDFYPDIRMEINTSTIYKTNVLDISMHGLGFMIEDTESVNLKDFNETINFFINIFIENRVILTEVKKVWSIELEEAGKKLLKGGLAFSIMSPEDRLYLSEYINSIRS